MFIFQFLLFILSVAIFPQLFCCIFIYHVSDLEYSFLLTGKLLLLLFINLCACNDWMNFCCLESDIHWSIPMFAWPGLASILPSVPLWAILTKDDEQGCSRCVLICELNVWCGRLHDCFTAHCTEFAARSREKIFTLERFSGFCHPVTFHHFTVNLIGLLWWNWQLRHSVTSYFVSSWGEKINPDISTLELELS